MSACATVQAEEDEKAGLEMEPEEPEEQPDGEAEGIATNLLLDMGAAMSVRKKREEEQAAEMDRLGALPLVFAVLQAQVALLWRGQVEGTDGWSLVCPAAMSPFKRMVNSFKTRGLLGSIASLTSGRSSS